MSELSVRGRRRILERRKRKLERRLRKIQWEDQPQPMLNGTNIHYEVSEKVKAINCGGLGAIHKMIQWCGLVKEINAELNLLKFHVSESYGNAVILYDVIECLRKEAPLPAICKISVCYFVLGCSSQHYHFL